MGLYSCYFKHLRFAYGTLNKQKYIEQGTGPKHSPWSSLSPKLTNKTVYYEMGLQIDILKSTVCS